MLPATQRPEHTEGYEGFYHLVGMKGEVELAELSYIVRDHSREKFEQKKEYLQRVEKYMAEKYGEGVVSLALRDQYYNMREMVEPHPEIIDKAKEAMENAGVTPIVKPIRGGTDGSRLSYMGLPCPNLCTGGYNFHSRYEYASLPEMERSAEVLIRLAKL